MSDSPRNHRKPAGRFFPHFLHSRRLPAGTYSGGSGTAEDPYQISTVADWQELANNLFDWSYPFVLTNHLDFEGVTVIPIGYADFDKEGQIYGTPFTGIFDGNGYSIRNPTLTDYESSCLGLFRWIGPGGQVKNLGVVGLSISGYYGIGGLCGYNDSGTITDCYAAGGVTGDVSVGILCGSNRNGTIDRCFAIGEARGSTYSTGGLCGVNDFGTISTSYSTSTVTGWSNVGGLCGFNAGTIDRCFASGTVTGDVECVGGLCGANDGTIGNCYATGDVTGNDRSIGGLCGASKGTIQQCYSTGKVFNGVQMVGGLCGGILATVIDSFWDMETSGQTTSEGGTGKTTAEMKQVATFTNAGWDFSYADGDPADWRIVPNAYPRLVWQKGYSGGSGTAEDPYTISTVADWQELIGTSDDWDKHFNLLNDIDFEGINLTPIAPDIDPVRNDHRGHNSQGFLKAKIIQSGTAVSRPQQEIVLDYLVVLV